MFNHINGKGKIVYDDGDSYEGEWKDDKAHGFGVYISHNGSVYEGYWFENQQCGQGV